MGVTEPPALVLTIFFEKQVADALVHQLVFEELK